MTNKSVEEYKIILDSQYKSFNLALGEVIHSYPLFKTLKLDEYKNAYLKDMENLERIKSDIFMNMNNLRNDSEILSNSIASINKKIGKMNKENSRLSKELSALENNDTAAEGELDTRKKRFYIKLVENFFLVSIIVSSLGYYIKKHYDLK